MSATSSSCPSGTCALRRTRKRSYGDPDRGRVPAQELRPGAVVNGDPTSAGRSRPSAGGSCNRWSSCPRRPASTRTSSCWLTRTSNSSTFLGGDVRARWNRAVLSPARWSGRSAPAPCCGTGSAEPVGLPAAPLPTPDYVSSLPGLLRSCVQLLDGGLTGAAGPTPSRRGCTSQVDAVRRVRGQRPRRYGEGVRCGNVLMPRPVGYRPP